MTFVTHHPPSSFSYFHLFCHVMYFHVEKINNKKILKENRSVFVGRTQLAIRNIIVVGHCPLTNMYLKNINFLTLFKFIHSVHLKTQERPLVVSWHRKSDRGHTRRWKKFSSINTFKIKALQAPPLKKATIISTFAVMYLMKNKEYFSGHFAYSIFQLQSVSLCKNAIGLQWMFTHDYTKRSKRGKKCVIYAEVIYVILLYSVTKLKSFIFMSQKLVHQIKVYASMFCREK